MSDAAARLAEAKVVPVIRTATEAGARTVVTVLRDAGFTLFEIALTTPNAMALIADLAANPRLTVGAGTILDAEQGRTAVAAGASFAVSPAIVPDLVEACAGAPVALGAATPTEALRAHEAGAAFVKLFPAAQLGGPGFVKALKSVYPHMAFMPTGGIGPGDVRAYLDAGAACLGMGGNLVSGREATIRAGALAVRAEIG